MMVWPGPVMSCDSYSLNEFTIVRRCPFENVRARVPFSLLSKPVMLAPNIATVRPATWGELSSCRQIAGRDRKSTRLNSSHQIISYAVFCLKKNIDHAAFISTINPDTNKIPKPLFQGSLNIYKNYFKPRCILDRTESKLHVLKKVDVRYVLR